jgi:geranylgeranyl transferase type-2 subunit alpha
MPMLNVVHGWGYRRYVVSNIEKLRGISLAKSEFDYTTSKTNNISNFSAWHNRANLIPYLLPSITADNFEEERKAFLQRGYYFSDSFS